MKIKSFLLIVCLVVVLCESLYAEQIRIVTGSSNLREVFTESDCVYAIQGVVNLTGKTIQIPPKSLLDFRSGAITNGVLEGNETRLKGLHDRCIGFRSKGTWIVDKIDDSFFDQDLLNDNQIITAINAYQRDDIENRIILHKGKYECSIKKEGGSLLRLSSNTYLTLRTTIFISGNNFRSYNVILIKDKENVTVSGGVLIGDVGKHQYIEGTDSQWGHGILISNSRHVTIKNVTAMNCMGDGFTITGGVGSSIGDMSQASRDITIKNVVAKYNRRQGLSIIYGEDITVKNSTFSDTGTIEAHSPSAGIDIEPNIVSPYFQSVAKVRITGCRFERNVGASVLTNHYVSSEGKKSIASVYFKKCVCDGRIELHSAGVQFERTSMSSLILSAEKDPIENIEFSNCRITENGISLYSSDKKKNAGTGIRNIRFNKCRISSPVESLARNQGSPVFRTGNTQNIEGIVLTRCEIETTK